jgi:DNA uptake protein ComE-like DNA-binding protein
MMHRPAIPVLLGTATLLIAFAGCQDASQETPEAGETPAVSAAAEAPVNVQTTPAAPADGTLLDPNQATREELLAMPGVDEPLADAIVAGRPFDDMLAVDRVLAGRLGEEQREAVYGRLWKPLDLNRASGEEILLIPGVGPKMRHEFEEYRPYRSMEQFRREIGKYVDDTELARLERYVTLR